jgi:hypothetical protein
MADPVNPTQWYSLTPETVAQQLQVDPASGLSADEAQRRLELSLEPGFATLFVGASGWRWDLNPDGANGYYIRELSWRLDLKSADSATGRVVLDVDGYASHTSMVMYDAMVNVFSIDVVVVPLARGQAVPVSAEGTFDVGTSEASLDPVEGTLR